MLIEHLGKAPTIDPAAFVAANAVVCGDVTVLAGARIMYGAQIIAEGGSITIGRECIVMENAVLRSSAAHPLTLGANCLVGPNAHVVGSTIENEVFLATGCAVFHGSHIGAGAEVRINGVVHLKTRIAPGATVPIGWVAVGDPARMFPASEHEALWPVQQPLNFPLTVYGFDRDEASMVNITRRLSETLASHFADVPIA
ncbi:MAG: gamma carbonic anhydrase family protein [Rhodospirillales bacterium]|nr:gamma carbonic anhydrase family protein [Rhodospirillales bacterium]